MSIKSEVVQAVRSWLKANSATTALTDAQVIPSYEKGPRPSLPYLTVGPPRPVTVGETEEVQYLAGTLGATPYRRSQEHQDATVSINGYGEGAEEWIQTARLSLQDEAVQAALATLGVDIRMNGGMQDLTGLLDTAFEPRVLQEIVVSYRLTGAGRAQVELLGVRVTTDLDSDPDAIAETYTITP